MTQSRPDRDDVPQVPIADWNTADLMRRLGLTLDGGAGIGEFVHGRVVGVLASPQNATSTDMAVGVSALPEGFATPAHSHRAEEVAIVLEGRGTITIDGTAVDVAPGSVVLTPAHTVHMTAADADSRLLVLWIYAPPGSERRWLQPAETKGTF